MTTPPESPTLTGELDDIADNLKISGSFITAIDDG